MMQSQLLGDDDWLLVWSAHEKKQCFVLQVKFVKGNTLAMARIQVEKLICVEKFENVPQLGRFTLRDEGRTIAVGKIERLPKSAKA